MKHTLNYSDYSNIDSLLVGHSLETEKKSLNVFTMGDDVALQHYLNVDSLSSGTVQSCPLCLCKFFPSVFCDHLQACCEYKKSLYAQTTMHPAKKIKGMVVLTIIETVI